MSSTLAAQNRVSRTAFDCAAIRAAVFSVTDCLESDHLAFDLITSMSAPLEVRAGRMMIRIGLAEAFRRMAVSTSPGVDVFLFARQMVADDIVREALDSNDATQCVILGAGLDTSALRIGDERRLAGKNPGKFFEVDLPEMQAEKRRGVAGVLKRRPDLSEANIVYVPCSFGEDSLGAVLTGAGFDPALPTVWIWSGVVHYLPEEAVRSTVDEMRAVSAAGSKLFFDFTVAEAYKEPDKFGFAGTKKRFDRYGEIMSFGFREGAEHVTQWLGKRGLKVERCYSNEDMIALYEKKTGSRAQSKGTPWAMLCIAEF